MSSDMRYIHYLLKIGFELGIPVYYSSPIIESRILDHTEILSIKPHIKINTYTYLMCIRNILISSKDNIHCFRFNVNLYGGCSFIVITNNNRLSVRI